MENGAYVTDVTYPAQFVRELMPLWLGSTLTSLGRLAPDVDQAFDWLELGCGAGLSTLVAAANHPAAHFTGIDLSQREIERATALATRAGLANVDFICQSIEAAADAENSTSPPKRDFIVCNGVYSWVGEPVRKAVERIVAQQLRPSGVAYLSYMSQPGAASFSAAQRLLRLMARGHPGDSAAQARNGMNLLLSLEQAGAGYFVEHPAAARDMQQASAGSDAALAHEYLNEHWQAFHAADILQSFTSIGCEWAGSAMPLDNIDAVSLPAQVQPIVQQLRQQGADALLLETVRDIARNQNSRMDIFQKARSSLATNRLDLSEHRQALLRQKVMLAPPARLGELTSGQHLVLSTRIGPVDIPFAQVQPLLEAVQDAPRSYAELASLPAYAGNPGFINQVLQVLAWAGWIRFIRSPTSTDLEEIEQRCQRLQQVLKDAGLGDWHIDAHAATAMPQGSA
ncbi:class I SAM-dependent methyltransferase [Corticibacter populi]|uniref:class I SAM-dependent methyltransferase n=1 Tax=Corticibacter populi TaxID=1550736 RepID=UPI0013EEAF68|nr:class I SAM-dependent methyltransferase [Corticibacter populi]